MASLVANSAAATRGRDEVHVAAVPLRATKGPPQLFMTAAYNIHVWDLQHFMVIIKPFSPPSNSKAFVFDFQPQDPESIYTAVEVLSGKAVPGTVLVRKLKRLPRKKCWFVGFSKPNAIDIAHKFNEKWEIELRVGRHDCRDYTNALVEHLTGNKHVLSDIRSIHSQS